MEPEIQAMADISAALAALQPEEVRRVLKWANEKYQVKPAPGAGFQAGQVPGVGVVSPQANGEYADFPSLFDAAAPATGLERILLCGYWYQVVQGMQDFDSQSLNSELKNMGHPSRNITRDVESLINRSPKLVIQTRKEGKSKQARKKFRITQEGIREVQRMFERKQAAATE